MASGPHYAPLAEDDFESDDPGSHTHPAPSQAHTRPASPTATLQAYLEIQWIYAGVEYDSFENAICASANSLGITNQAYVDWTISVTRDITRREVVNVYNVLSNKVYEHRNDFLKECDTTHATFRQMDSSMTGLHTKADTAGNLALKAVEENKQLKAEIITVKADLDMLNHNNMELVKWYKELTAKFMQLEQDLSNCTMFGITTAPAPVVSQASRIKASESPKYKGNKGSEVTLEQCLQKMGLWFRIQNITTDDDKITLALTYLEGGVHDYIEDYIETAASGESLGTWTDFVNRLKAGYRQLAPEKTAQTSLKEWCSKTHTTVIQFAENFGRYASKSGYADVELIHRIDNQVGMNSQILTVMTAMQQVNLMLIPTKWEHYLDWVLKLEMETRGNQAKLSLQQHTTSRPLQNPNAMDVDTKKLSKEQLEWLDKKL
ncbi:hypothetical protein DICSQDRAFT_171460 [Dichomitus squalens LYAD-421 SS1]|uniref:Uncharacterized protein n=1 Tax=Dichomitus squalens (strain LYAD-421) TaxID=732165 RepID=R7SVL9_DICSQ|nr:uncharacterized protein DICSQDRAFT_171460 [Dichomitus squalens LYAD-421 SS1]EJF59973.1 hypothetical protein DICSQDRAFT_171460 [Dichomitus squalens LYAD-421 SS1]